ncbi:MAG: phosphate ABC transporter substrate-binding protein PstS [Saprospiraceae bacterium]
MQKAVFFLLISCFSNGLWSQAKKDTLFIDGSNGVKPLVEAVAATFQKNYPDIKVIFGEGMSTSARIEALQAEEIDVAMASHGLDIPRFTKQGLQVDWFAKMAIVIGVNKEVELKKITSQQLCAIYDGTITNWQTLGGENKPIQALARPSDEVDMEVLQEHLPCFSDVDERSFLQFHQKSGPLAQALSNTPGAIGMTAAVRQAQSEGKIKPLTVDGIKPKLKQVEKGKYPFTRNAYLIFKGTPDPVLKRFLMFFNSKTGQKILKANYAVPIEK